MMIRPPGFDLLFINYYLLFGIKDPLFDIGNWLFECPLLV